MNQQNTNQNIKDIAKDFLRFTALGNVREAFSKYVASNFRHHNPYFKGDANSLMIAMEDNAKSNPNKLLEIQRALQDGDLVAVHSKVKLKPQGNEIAVVHIFRFENNLIAELWDIGQPMPENSPNEFGLF